MEDELIGYVERECEKLRPAKAASELSAGLGKRREILIAGDTARCHGFEDACCQDCSRKLQIAIDDDTRWYPYMCGAPVKGCCIFKIRGVEKLA